MDPQIPKRLRLRTSPAEPISTAQRRDRAVIDLSLNVLAPQRYAGKTFSINVNPFEIGRDPRCHLCPSNPTASRRHCTIRIDGERVILRDTKSTNGTLVNKRLVQGETELVHGDRIRIGPLVFGVRIDDWTPLITARHGRCE
jgi:pSer/pThr/pTyr-binding forkhead associated (FHA) protein